ncbi:hypothetical protein LXL04_020511 [Taraxacum kok-saghyz]
MATNPNTLVNSQLPKFNGKNYHHWSIQMKVLCEAQDLWDIVKYGIDKPDNFDDLSEEEESELKVLKKNDRKALYLIYQAIDEIIFERISSSNCAQEAWNMLYKTYRGEDKVKIVKLQTLICEFDALGMKDSDTIKEFYNRAIIILNQLRINESKDLTTLSLESLLGTLQSHELRMRQFDNTTFEQAFQTQNSQERNNQSKESSENKGKRKKPLFQIQCYHSQKFGHIAKFCRKRIAEERERGTTFVHREENETETMFMILSTQETQFNDIWYVDSGCSNHMTANRGIFISMDESQRREVRTGDDTSLSVNGIGDIMVDTSTGKKRIPDVYFILGLKHNLLSVGQLRQKGYNVMFKKEACEIQDQNGTTLGKINMTTNKIFLLRFKKFVSFNFKTSSDQNSLLWHQRFGHANLGYLSYMYKHGMVRGMPNISKLMKFVKVAFWVNMQGILFLKTRHGEQVALLNYFTHTSVVL